MAGRVTRHGWRAGLVVALAAACGVTLPASAHATVITVTTASDIVNANDGLCSYREALPATAPGAPASGPAAGECPAGGAQDTVVLPAGTYTLNPSFASAPSVVSDAVTIAGAGAAMTTITEAFPSGSNKRGLSVSGSVVVQDITFANLGPETNDLVYPGYGSKGGAILNLGSLEVRRCVFTGNYATGGGAIANYQRLTVSDSTFTSNSAAGTTSTAPSTPAPVTGAGGSNGSPGGSGSSATGGTGGNAGDGGAILSDGTLVVERSVFTGNHAGNGAAGGAATGGAGGNGVAGSSTGGAAGDGTGGAGGNGGSGGAIMGLIGAGDSLTIADSTISGNGAGNGGDGGSGTGGHGGTGGSGGIGPGGTGGKGGAGTGGLGGNAGSGGGVFIRMDDPSPSNTLTIERTLLKDNSAGHGGNGGVGLGGSGGSAGSSAAAGNGGAGGVGQGADGGFGGVGGGVGEFTFLTGPDPGFLSLSNATLTTNSAGSGGNGGTATAGQGGSGTNGGVQGASGGATGGDGGSGANGGAAEVDVFSASHVTVDANSAGAGGTAGSPAGSAGTPGAGGGISAHTILYTGGSFPPAKRELANSILSSNAGGNCAFVGYPVQRTNNVSFPDTSCGPNLGDPLLQPLADNGGPTQTHALGPGSPALDLITGNCSATDQRGVARPQLSGCDAGAYEVAPPNVTTGAASGTTIAGSINANQRATSYHFEFGLTDAYGSSTTTENLPAGNSSVGVSADLSGLAPSSTYHYRLVASNADGASNGADQTFTTAAAPTTGGSDQGGSTPGSATPGGSTTPAGSTQPSGASAVADRTAPKFLSASLKPATLRRSALLKFSLSEAAKVTITIQSLKPRKRVARLTVSAIGAVNRKTIRRKLGKRRLKPGRYLMTLQASDAAGNRSTARRIKFRVV